MWIAFFRTILFYFALILFLRLMGKKQLGELQPTELAVTLLIADLASIPVQATNIPLLSGLVPIATLLILEVIMSWISLKSPLVRKWISGSPIVVIENGKINQKALTDLRFNIDDLMEGLRLKDISCVEDVAFAIIETNGKLSVFPKAEKRPLTPEDMNMSVTDKGISMILIADGKPEEKNLNKLQLDQAWLKKELKKRHICDIQQVFFCSINQQKELHIEEKS